MWRYTQLTQCIDKSWFILPSPFTFTFNSEPPVTFFVFSKTYPITSYPFTPVNLTLTQCHVRLTLLFRSVYLNGNNAAERENNVKNASSYPMNNLVPRTGGTRLLYELNLYKTLKRYYDQKIIFFFLPILRACSLNIQPAKFLSFVFYPKAVYFECKFWISRSAITHVQNWPIGHQRVGSRENDVIYSQA